LKPLAGKNSVSNTSLSKDEKTGFAINFEAAD
jgi:hypothetical protein